MDRYSITQDGKMLILDRDIILSPKDADVFKKVEVVRIKKGVNIQVNVGNFFPNLKTLIQEEPFPSIWYHPNQILGIVPTLYLDFNEQLTELVLDCLAKHVENFEVNPDNSRYSTINGMLCSKDGKRLIRCPINKYDELIIPEGIEVIEKWGCSHLRSSSVKFPDSLTTLCEYAFAKSGNLHNLKFEKSNLNIIPEGAFSYCFKLEIINPPDSVYSIEDRAFYQCTSLDNITLPKKLEYIGDRVFDGCIKLKNINIPSSVKFIGRHSLIDTEAICVENMPKGIVSAFAGNPNCMISNRISSKNVKNVVTVEFNDKKIFFPKYMKESVIASLDLHISNIPQQLYTKGISDIVCQDTALALYEYNNDECARVYLNRNIGNILYRIANNHDDKQLIAVLKLNLGSRKVLESLYKKIQSTLSVTANAYFLKAIQENESKTTSFKL